MAQYATIRMAKPGQERTQNAMKRNQSSDSIALMNQGPYPDACDATVILPMTKVAQWNSVEHMCGNGWRGWGGVDLEARRALHGQMSAGEQDEEHDQIDERCVLSHLLM